MKYELTPPYSSACTAGKPVLNAYPTPIGPENSSAKRPAVIICGGGAYNHISYRESHPVALRFQSYGMSAFSLDYSVDGKPFPTALTELAEAVAFVKENAAEWNTDPEKVIVCGFSAGAHLAASLAVHHSSDFMREMFGERDIRPFGQILCYPVITGGKYTHKGSLESIAGASPSEETIKLVSCEENVSEATPPCFLWHCADDATVPVMNSILYMNALAQANVPFEAHIFPKGGHGIALCDDTALKEDDPRYLNETAAQWFPLALDWVRRLCSVKYR